MQGSKRGAIGRVGMLGLGSMGGPIAANVARGGFEVWAYDPRPAALEAARAAGITACASPAEVARATEVTLAIPFDYGQIEQAVFGPNGLVEGLDGPGLFVCMSTVGPDNARELGQRLAERGHRLVDAPVSGGATGAAEGTLTVIVGAASADLERCRPLLATFAANIFHVGEAAGTGQAAKLVNQLLVLTHLAATVEALSLGVRSGVDPHQLYAMIRTAAGTSRIFELRGESILNRSFKSGGSLNILVKDARLVMRAGEASGTPLVVAAAAGQLFEMAKAYGLGDEDDVALAKLYETIGQMTIG